MAEQIKLDMLIGKIIIAYGQEVKVLNVVISEIMSTHRIELEHPIVVPGREYTRDWITQNEIQKIKPE